MTTNAAKGGRRAAIRFGLALCVGALAFQALAGARETVAFVCGHPDDLAGWSGTALLLAKRYDVHVIDYTHGERGLGEPGYRDGSTRKLRTKEEECVCAAVGATLHWLDEIDGEASVPAAMVEKMAALLREIRPKAVILHWPIDTHCDHVMSYAAAWRAIQLVGLRGTTEVYFGEQSHQSRSFRPTVFVDISGVREARDRVIAMYKCQNPDSIIERKRNDARFWGQRVQMGYVEAFAVADGTVKGPGILASLAIR